MTREIVNSDVTAQITNKADVKTLLDDLDAIHDPDNDKEVNHVTVSFTTDDDGNRAYDVQATVRYENVADKDIPAKIDELGADVSGLTGIDIAAEQASENARLPQ